MADSSQGILVLDRERRFKVFFRPLEAGHIELQFENVPSFVHALKMAPKAREPELHRGTWLVLVFAIWSQNDVGNIVDAVRSLEGFEGKIRVGIRPFKEYEETRTWYQDYGSSESPLWLVVRDGQVLHEEKGVRSEDEIVQFVKRALKQ